MPPKNTPPSTEQYWGEFGDSRWSMPTITQNANDIDLVHVIAVNGPLVGDRCLRFLFDEINHASEATPILLSLDCPGGDPVLVSKLIDRVNAAQRRGVALAVHIEHRCYGAALLLTLAIETRFATPAPRFGQMWRHVVNGLPEPCDLSIESFTEQCSWDITETAVARMNAGGTLHAEYCELLGLVTELTPTIDASAESFRDRIRWK